MYERQAGDIWLSYVLALSGTLFTHSNVAPQNLQLLSTVPGEGPSVEAHQSALAK